MSTHLLGSSSGPFTKYSAFRAGFIPGRAMTSYRLPLLVAMSPEAFRSHSGHDRRLGRGPPVASVRGAPSSALGGCADERGVGASFVAVVLSGFVVAAATRRRPPVRRCISPAATTLPAVFRAC